MNSRDMGYMFGIIILVVLLGIGISYAFRSTPETPNSPEEQDTAQDDTATRHVTLYYPDATKAEGEDIDECSADVLAGVDVELEDSETIMEDTITALITRELTDEEQAQGFTSEFPHSEFELTNSTHTGGELVLTFTEVPGFTSGGSCRVNVLREQITQTALQFNDVDSVIIQPETLFQP